MSNRRSFIIGSSAVSAGTILGIANPLSAINYGRTEVENIRDSRLKELIMQSIDSAVSAGASYADARLSHSQALFASGYSPKRTEHMSFGVRAIVNGFWGFASSPLWNLDEAERLGIAAVEQAKINGAFESRELELASVVNPESGDWIMPVKDDPFKMAYEEISDYLNPLLEFIMRMEKVNNVIVHGQFHCTEKAFGNSSGQFNTQKLYNSSGIVFMNLVNRNGSSFSNSLDTLSPAGMGFELFRDQPLRENIQKIHEETISILELPEAPIDVGRYETLINNKTVADLVSKTIGRPTEIDTAFGHEANAGGTGFIDPVTMLGNFKIGSSLLNITGDRSRVGSVGCVKWDDEGVKPIKFDIVKDGIVVGMQCNREGAGWIGDYLKRTGQSVRSVGCAYAPNAMDVPMIHNVDLTVAPSENNNSLDSLRAVIKKGIELKNPLIGIDFQSITGFTRSNALEIRNGKRVARSRDASMLFKTPELWNNIIDIGGSESSDRFGIDTTKGEPMQRSTASVYAIPALFKEMTFTGLR